MSLLENLGKSIGSMILIISIVGLVFAYGFAQATDYDSLKPVFTDLTASQLKSVSDSEQLRSLINQQCLSTDTITMPIGNTMLELDCKELQSAEDIEKYASGKIFDSFYYKEYDCSAIECLQNALGPEKQNLGVLVSDKMHSLLETMMIYLIAGIILGILVLAISLRKLFPIVKTIGISMIIAGISFIPILVMELLLPISQNSLLGFLGNIMNTFVYLYAAIFAAGIVFCIIGRLGPRYSGKDHGKMHKRH